MFVYVRVNVSDCVSLIVLSYTIFARCIKQQISSSPLNECILFIISLGKQSNTYNILYINVQFAP